MIFFGVLGRLIEKWLPGRAAHAGERSPDRGEGGIISTEPARRLMELAALVRADAGRARGASSGPDDARCRSSGSPPSRRSPSSSRAFERLPRALRRPLPRGAEARDARRWPTTRAVLPRDPACARAGPRVRRRGARPTRARARPTRGRASSARAPLRGPRAARSSAGCWATRGRACATARTCASSARACSARCAASSWRWAAAAGRAAGSTPRATSSTSTVDEAVRAVSRAPGHRRPARAGARCARRSSRADRAGPLRPTRFETRRSRPRATPSGRARARRRRGRRRRAARDWAAARGSCARRCAWCATRDGARSWQGTSWSPSAPTPAGSCSSPPPRAARRARQPAQPLRDRGARAGPAVRRRHSRAAWNGSATARWSRWTGPRARCGGSIVRERERRGGAGHAGGRSSRQPARSPSARRSIRSATRSVWEDADVLCEALGARAAAGACSPSPRPGTTRSRCSRSIPRRWSPWT